LLFGDQVVSLSRPTTDGNTVSSTMNSISVVTKNGARMSADQVVLAIGRVPNTRQLGLDTVGVEVDAIGAIKVSAMSQTSVPSIYAVGDVTNRLNLTPVAIRQGHAFADSAFSERAWEVDYDLIPTAVFSTPEVGCVGLTELEARARHTAVDVYVTEFLTPKVELTRTAQRTLLKVVVDGHTQHLLGVHLFSEEASELIQPLAIAMRAGATIDHFREAMAMHPSFSEAMLDLEAPTLRYDRIVPDPKAPDSTGNNMPLRTAI
jgi:glutathione reductase (NADPH)